MAEAEAVVSSIPPFRVRRTNTMIRKIKEGEEEKKAGRALALSTPHSPSVSQSVIGLVAVSFLYSRIQSVTATATTMYHTTLFEVSFNSALSVARAKAVSASLWPCWR